MDIFTSPGPVYHGNNVYLADEVWFRWVYFNFTSTVHRVQYIRQERIQGGGFTFVFRVTEVQKCTVLSVSAI